MKKEELIALGLTEEQADALIGKYGNMIPKDRFDGVNSAKKTLETQVANYENQLKDLQSKVKDGADLQTEIANLQNELKQAKADYEQQLKDERLSTALKLALVNKVHDADLVAGLLDKSKVELDEKGEVKGGLDEQLKALHESKAFLFVPEKEEKKQPTFQGFDPVGTDGDKDGNLDIGSQFAKEMNARGGAKDENSPWN